MVLARENALTLQERVKAQEAIERVYYTHRIWPKENPGPKPSFEKMIPKEVIEAKVNDYLKKCSALDKFWQRPITGEQLQAEMDRMVRGTKDPETLKELFEALDNDPHLIAECLARPVLADRLVHNWYANDSRFHGELKAQAEALREQLTPTDFPYLAPERYQGVTFELEDAASEGGEEALGSNAIKLDEEEFRKALEAYPEEGAISPVIETNDSFLIRWTRNKTERLLEFGVLVFEKKSFNTWFEGISQTLSSQVPAAVGSYTLKPLAPPSPDADPTGPDSWKALWYSPTPREEHTAVWTGTEMIVWGGYNYGPSQYYLQSGGKYAPATDSWVATSTGTNCPSARCRHSAVWTGTEMIVWVGGEGTTY